MGPYGSENFKMLLIPQLWFFFNQTFYKYSLWQSLQNLLIGILNFHLKKGLKFNIVVNGKFENCTPPTVIILWESLQKLLIEILFNIFKDWNLTLWPMGNFKKMFLHSFDSFPLKRFVNVPCDRYCKRYILGFWNSIQKKKKRLKSSWT